MLLVIPGFPDSSAGKESTCNAGDPSSIPGSERCPGEGIGYPVQYSWASLVAQLVKSLPTMQETWVQSLGWEDTLEKGKATHSHILAWIVTHDWEDNDQNIVKRIKETIWAPFPRLMQKILTKKEKVLINYAFKIIKSHFQLNYKNQFTLLNDTSLTYEITLLIPL